MTKICKKPTKKLKNNTKIYLTIQNSCVMIKYTPINRNGVNDDEKDLKRF